MIFLSFSVVLFDSYRSLSGIAIGSQIQNIPTTGLYPYVVLCLCTAFFITRTDFRAIGKQRSEISYFLLGLGLISLSVFLSGNSELPFIIFKICLGLSGLFFLIFGKPALFPTYLLSIYGFSIAFPKFVDGFITETALISITWMTAKLSSVLVPVSQIGNTIRIVSLTNENLVILINAACSGSAAIALFVAIFALMMADIPLPRRDAAIFFILGVAGTFGQNIVRLVVLVLTGYYFGGQTLSAVHEVLGYVLFGMYYVLFAYLYLKKARTLNHSIQQS